VLLSDLFNQDVFASALSEFVVNYRAWYEDKEKHIEENEDNEEGVVSFRVLDGWSLVVRVVVIAAQYIHLHDHLPEVVEIACVLIEANRMVWKFRVLERTLVINHLRANKCES
jgi:hypothetical protein